MAARVLDEVRERALERRPVAADATGAGASTATDPSAPAARASSSSRTSSRGRLGRLLAGEGEQVVGEPREPLGILLELLDELGRRAVAREVRDVAAQRGQRRAQLVRGVGEEAALGVARPLEAGEHRVQRRREPPDLVGRRGLGQPAARVARALDLRGRVGEPSERPQRSAHQHGERDRGERRGSER